MTAFTDLVEQWRGEIEVERQRLGEFWGLRVHSASLSVMNRWADDLSALLGQANEFETANTGLPVVPAGCTERLSPESTGTLRAMITQWRADARFNPRETSPGYICGVNKCADQLESALLVQEAPQEEEKTDLTRVDKGVGSRSTGSTASTD